MPLPADAVIALRYTALRRRLRAWCWAGLFLGLCALLRAFLHHGGAVGILVLAGAVGASGLAAWVSFESRVAHETVALAYRTNRAGLERLLLEPGTGRDAWACTACLWLLAAQDEHRATCCKHQEPAA